MGCFCSTPKNDQNNLKNQFSNLRSQSPKSNATQEAKCRATQPPPPPPLSVVEEEEFVKEVLLETQTPISKPQVPILNPETKTQIPFIETTKDPIINKPLEEASEDFSLISETCSMNESFSTTTTATVPETREDEVTSKRTTREGTRNRNRNRNRINYDASRTRCSNTVEGNRIGGRERRVKSPARVPENPLSKKVPISSRSVRRREFSDQVRRDSGEKSSRRSRSPSCSRTVGTGAGYSQHKPPAGGGRRLLPPPKCESVEVVGEINDGVSMNESLEDPRVSLECFIFL